MKDLRTRTKDIIDKYANELASLGIKIEVTKRYFETNVGERYETYYAQTGIFNIIFDDISRANDHKK